MNKMKGLLIMMLAFFAIEGSSQSTSRINEIRELYKAYNNEISSMDSYEISYNTGGAFPEIAIYTDYQGKVLVKQSEGTEFTSFSSEYYYLDGSIQFIYYSSNDLLNHWSEDVVRFKKTELRFYFENGKVIKTLKKEFEGVEGEDDDFDMTSLANEEIEYTSVTNWNYFSSQIVDLLRLVTSLDKVF